MLPFRSLASATAPGPGSARDLETVARLHTMVVEVTGGPGDQAGVMLSGSHDGLAWFSLGGIGAALPGVSVVTTTASAHLVRHVRAEVQSGSVSGSPIVSATIASEA